MNNFLNFILQFTTNAEKVSASVKKLSVDTLNVENASVKVNNAFTNTINSINSNLKTIRLSAVMEQFNAVSDGLTMVAEPGMKFSTAMADLSAITGQTGKELELIGNAARANAKAFGGSAAESVESYKLLLSQLSPAIAQQPKALAAMGKSVSVLSKTMGGNAVAATEVLTTAMNQFQISTDDPIKASKEMSVMMNVMAAAAKQGSAELPQIKQALENSGMAAKAAGVSFAETNAAIQVLDKAGKKGAEGGVALRNVMGKLAEGRFLPKDTQAELQKAGINVNALGDKNKTLAERLKLLKPILNDNALVTKMFGTENANAALALINGITEQERLTKAIQGTNTAQEQASVIMKSPEEQLKRMKARVDNFKISLFNTSSEAFVFTSIASDLGRTMSNLLPIFSGVRTVLSHLTNAEKRQVLWERISTISKKIASAAVVVYGTVVGLLTGKINFAAMATSVWTSVQAGFNAVMAMNPVVLIVAGIIALIAAIGYVIYKTDGWGKAWQHTVQGAKAIMETFVNGVKLYFTTLVNGMMIGLNTIKKGWYEFKKAVGLGDANSNKNAIAKINADTEARKKAIVDGAKKVTASALKAKDEFSKAAGSLTWNSNKSLSGMTTGLKKQLGIAPTTNNNLNVLGGAATKPTNTNKEAKKTNEAISTGGAKQQTITLNFKDVVGHIEIAGKDFKENAATMQKQVEEAVMRVLAMAITTAG